MEEQAAIQTEGFYRCTGEIGETAYCEVGKELPRCNCEGGGSWEFRKEDNMYSEDATTVLVGHGITHAIKTDERLEVGAHLNIREDKGEYLKTGEHRVTSVNPNFQWRGKSTFWILVERVGDLADNLPIHQATMNVNV